MKNYSQLADSDGEELVKTSRAIITNYLDGTKIELNKNFESKYSFNSGVFITLNNKEGLRGCIGFPLPDKKLFRALTDAAIAAATEDPRFPPVKTEELNEITFEVTILTTPIQIQVSDPTEYPSKIKVGRDGLIVKYSFNSGLLLPQVPVEYGWSEEEFLGYTCEKAGIPKNYWKKKETKILKFQGIVFKEERPNGNVVREKL